MFTARYGLDLSIKQSALRLKSLNYTDTAPIIKPGKLQFLRFLEKLEEFQDGQDNDKRVAIYTDSKTTLDLLQNKFKRNRLIEIIRNKIVALTHLKWTAHFGWVKEQAGIECKELADRLAKEAAVEDGQVTYGKIPRDVIITREKENGLHMWQQQWMNTGKGAVTTAFFPSVSNTLYSQNL